VKEVQLAFDYFTLDAETRAYVQERAERIHNLARMSASSIVQIGQYLGQVKERIGHGNFLGWIGQEFNWSERSAQRFIQVHGQFKSAKLADLEIDLSALYLIAAPSMPEPVRASVMRRAENGEPVTRMGTRALVQRFAETGEMPEEDVTLDELIKERIALRAPAPPPRLKPSPAEEARLRELDKMRAQAKLNGERNFKIFSVVHAIEALNGTEFTAKELAGEILKMDTPDKDWRGQSEGARRMLAAICQELKK